MRAYGLLIAFVSFGASATPAIAAAPVETTAVVGPGTYHSISPNAPAAISVHEFRLDRGPVTMADFAKFVTANPSWRRDRVARVVADEGYLANWKSASEPGAEIDPSQPVTRVSWHAARAYCAARAMRLPTEAEWEVAAAASITQADGSSDPAWKAHLLDVYSQPAPAKLPRIGGAANFWGVRDLHGLVWEWVLDFSSSQPVDCGQGGRAGANGNFDFPSFERAAMRSALHADTTTPNLGFRCAADLSPRGSS